MMLNARLEHIGAMEQFCTGLCDLMLRLLSEIELVECKWAFNMSSERSGLICESEVVK